MKDLTRPKRRFQTRLGQWWELLNMAAQDPITPSSERFHIVLVPGFADSDALDQLEYDAS